MLKRSVNNNIITHENKIVELDEFEEHVKESIKDFSAEINEDENNEFE